MSLIFHKATIRPEDNISTRAREGGHGCYLHVSCFTSLPHSWVHFGLVAKSFCTQQLCWALAHTVGGIGLERGATGLFSAGLLHTVCWISIRRCKNNQTAKQKSLQMNKSAKHSCELRWEVTCKDSPRNAHISIRNCMETACIMCSPVAY